MMMPTPPPIRPHTRPSPLQRPLQRPPKTPGPALIHSLKHQQHAPDLEDRRPEKRRDPPRLPDLARELRRRVHEGQPDEEPVDDPHHGPEREDDGHQVRHVPVRVFQHHASNAPHHLRHRRCFPRRAVFCVRGVVTVDDEGVSAFAVVARPPLELHVGGALLAGVGRRLLGVGAWFGGRVVEFVGRVEVLREADVTVLGGGRVQETEGAGYLVMLQLEIV